MFMLVYAKKLLTHSYFIRADEAAASTNTGKERKHLNFFSIFFFRVWAFFPQQSNRKIGRERIPFYPRPKCAFPFYDFPMYPSRPSSCFDLRKIFSLHSLFFSIGSKSEISRHDEIPVNDSSFLLGWIAHLTRSSRAFKSHRRLSYIIIFLYNRRKTQQINSKPLSLFLSWWIETHS